MPTSDTPLAGSWRSKVRGKLDRLRRKSRSSTNNHDGGASDLRVPGYPNALAAELNRLNFHKNQNLAIHVDGASHQSAVTLTEHSETGLGTERETVILPPPDPTSNRQDIENGVIDRSDIHVADSIKVSKVPSDLWSEAYREAVENMGKDVDVAILKGENVAELFTQLEQLDKDTVQESAFLRGVKYLHSLQVPLERFKLALDLATPLTSIEPTTSAVFGVVRGVTAIAISFSTADLDFAKKIGEMLEQLSYIDDCDTLGQRTKKGDIYNALVSVYQKLLEFYNAAFRILTQKGVKIVMRVVLQDGRLPDIIKDFLRHADLLRKLVQKATWEIVEDIKAMLYDQEIAKWLGSGKMSRQHQLHVDLQLIRADNACEFLRADDKFINWFGGTGSQQLVIVGEMGSGKSVAMAFLVDELRRRSQLQLPQPKVCYHYCQNGASGEAAHILCVLILSILEQLPGLKKPFFEWYKRTLVSGLEPATNFKTLEAWLQSTLETLDRPLIFAIDALDECDGQSRRQLLASLKSISEKTPSLKLLVSTRPEEVILKQLDGMSKIAMESNAERDRLIAEKTVETRLPDLTDEVKALVIDALSCSAQGSAIWTRMTVELIDKRRITAPDPMRAFLDKMQQPRQLWELYANVYSRYTGDDSENQILATTALEALAVARRPLSILELGWAAALGAADDTTHTVNDLSKLVDCKRVMSLIHPFVARVDFADANKRQVKLVHQSVKEFVVGSPTLHGSRRADLSRSAVRPIAAVPAPIPHQGIERLESSILAICTRYLLLDEIGNTSLFTEERSALEELPQGVDLFDETLVPTRSSLQCSWDDWEQDMAHFDPTERGFGEFFVYASCHWPEHLGAVSADSLLPCLADMEILCSAGSTRLHNWIAQNCRPGCAIQPRFEFDSTLYDPLSITCLFGSDAMLQRVLEESDLAGPGDAFLPSPVMKAVDQTLQWADVSRLKLLWESKPGQQQIRELEFFRLVLGQWSKSPSQRHRTGWDGAFALLDDVYDKMVEGQWGRALISRAITVGCLPVVRRLFEAAKSRLPLMTELLSISQGENSLIGTAVLANHVDILEYLLEQPGMEAHVRHRNAREENVLHLASRFCNPAVFRQLVPLLRDGVPQRDVRGETVLDRVVTGSSAASRDSRAAASILLASTESVFSEQQLESLGVAELRSLLVSEATS
ncbi:hypothetical protein QBC39DRAFT_348224 [Podospora conica]|nr:hypothetical protein QBC39DRAFT_348224 [Schizothecium conicum]